MEHAASQRERVGETLGKLDVEHDDLRRETETVDASRAAAVEALSRAQAALEQVRRRDRDARIGAGGRARRNTNRVCGACERTSRSWRASRRGCRRSWSSTPAGGEFGDAARMVLVQANGHVGQQGAVADYLDVDRRYERAVEACLGDLLQHVIVERHDQAAAGLALVREHDAGRCGFVVIDPGSNGYHPREVLRMAGIVPVSDVLRIAGPHVATIQKVVPEAYVAETFEQAVAMSRQTSAPVATIEGDVLRGPHVVCGGAKAESRGILATKREIKELRDRTAADRDELARLTEDTARLEIAIAQGTTALAALTAEQHRQEMAIVSHEAQVTRAVRGSRQAGAKGGGDRARTAAGRGGAGGPRCAIRGGRRLGRSAPRGPASGPRSDCPRRSDVLTAAREDVDELSVKAADARAAHAAMVERTSALEAEVLRLEEAARDVEHRIAARAGELDQARVRRETLLQAISDEARTLDEDIRALEALRLEVRTADEAATTVRAAVDGQDSVIREARRVARRGSHPGQRARRGARDRAERPQPPGADVRRDRPVLAGSGAGGRRGDGAGRRSDARCRRDHRRRA